MVIFNAKKNNPVANLGNKSILWPAADKPRKNLSLAEYKSMIFRLDILNHTSGEFDAMRARILAPEVNASAAAFNDCLSLICQPKSLRNIVLEVSAHA